jgi:hypothetical protein
VLVIASQFSFVRPFNAYQPLADEQKREFVIPTDNASASLLDDLTGTRIGTVQTTRAKIRAYEVAALSISFEVV